MTFFFWTILNIALLLFFIYVCFRATKIIKEKVGRLAALVFVIGLLSFATKNKETDIALSQQQQDANNFVPETDNRQVSVLNASSKVVLADYFGTDLHMTVGLSRSEDQKELVPKKVDFSFEGLIGGHQWQPKEVSFNRNSQNGTINYTGHGLLQWCILGIPVYTQNKSFTGVINLQ